MQTKRERKAGAPPALSQSSATQSIGTFDGIAAACAALEQWVGSARAARVDLREFGAALDNNDQGKVPVLVGKREQFDARVVWLKGDSTEMQVWVEEGEKGYTVTFAVFVERIRAAVAAEKAK